MTSEPPGVCEQASFVHNSSAQLAVSILVGKCRVSSQGWMQLDRATPDSFVPENAIRYNNWSKMVNCDLRDVIFPLPQHVHQLPVVLVV